MELWKLRCNLSSKIVSSALHCRVGEFDNPFDILIYNQNLFKFAADYKRLKLGKEEALVCHVNFGLQK